MLSGDNIKANTIPLLLPFKKTLFTVRKINWAHEKGNTQSKIK